LMNAESFILYPLSLFRTFRSTDLTEKQTQLMEMIIRAEDAIVIDLVRKYYTRIGHLDRTVRQAFHLRANNHERFVHSLRTLHKIIEQAAKLRCKDHILFMFYILILKNIVKQYENSHMLPVIARTSELESACYVGQSIGYRTRHHYRNL
uniref:BBS2_C domain-containing protein n=1 Tax=Angiostrongylus cantonensis TaxID=6313 RepID=A0A158PC91_ANGCA